MTTSSILKTRFADLDRLCDFENCYRDASPEGLARLQLSIEIVLRILRFQEPPDPPQAEKALTGGFARRRQLRDAVILIGTGRDAAGAGDIWSGCCWLLRFSSDSSPVRRRRTRTLPSEGVRLPEGNGLETTTDPTQLSLALTEHVGAGEYRPVCLLEFRRLPACMEA